MKWSEISVHTTNEAIEPISNILHESGASGVVIEDPSDLERMEARFGEIYDLDPSNYPDEGVIVKAYLPQNSFLSETVEEIKGSISSLVQYGIDIGKNDVTLSEIHEEDWATAWKKYYKPVKISEKVTIAPTWEDYQPVSTDEIIIEMDPGMAFGTGTHPTTVLSIQALERFVRDGDVVLDVGTGSGILSVGSILLGAKQAYAYDLDDVAVVSAKNNAALNKVEDRVEAKQNDLLKGVTHESDVIVANILAEIIVKFPEDAFSLLKPGGYFITSGIIEGKKELVRESLLEAGFEIIETNKMEDWISFTARRPE
ncbi:50S ribosomal protein L11 methyltransferase [Salimicrobium halophilum]|uniref:Ribosomal protein L11 methyltransferase n=1 Tax=Salimicrobium halophilum TaxID=86666 RepID=A0A1G8PQF7_9BACI|nr:50S ribosomal protein L11 methyltransferase [Salimicrobium halophilum]SDI94455.1 [LSU ribosomal protein L11P]-lysine N-methyltransferase [Salimicrobium halophilum]